MYKRIKIAYWVTSFLFLLVFYRWVMPNWWVNISAASINLFLFIAISESFIHYKAIPQLFYRKRYQTFLWSMLGCALINGSLTLLATWSLLQPFSQSAYGALFLAWENLVYGIYFVLSAFIAFSICTKLIYDWLAVQKKMDELEKEKTQAELSFLKAQLNPHFLFNSLNLIYGHIDKNNIARHILVKFSDMLRYQLYECNHNMIAMEKEITYLKNFIALQQMRKSDSLQLMITFEKELQDMEIAPLLFIPFIENAFKYVSNDPDRLNYIDIAIKKDRDSILFSCLNSKETQMSDTLLKQGGIGILNTKRRLDLIYPNRHELKIIDDASVYAVNLKIVMNQNL